MAPKFHQLDDNNASRARQTLHFLELSHNLRTSRTPLKDCLFRRPNWFELNLINASKNGSEGAQDGLCVDKCRKGDNQ